MTQFDPASPEDQELLFGALVEATTNVICLVEPDGRIAFINKACRDVLGYRRREMVGRPFAEFLPPDERKAATRIFAATSRGEPTFRRRVRALRKDGTGVDLRINATPVRDSHGNVRGVAAIAMDVSDEVRTERRLREMSDRYRTLVERLPAVSYVAEPGEQGRWRYVSPQIEWLLGYSPLEWVSDPGLWARCLHPEDHDRVIDEESRDVAWADPDAIEYRLVAKDGRVVWVRDEALLRIDPDGTKRYDGMLTDITERKNAESELQYLAERDPLTGLFNRRRFLDELGVEIKIVRRHGRHSALVMLDIDGLKHVNDSLGHQAGDALLRTTADAFRQRLRDTDTIGRIGGDEFAALLRGADERAALKVANDLVAAVRARSHDVVGDADSSTVSAGLVELTGDPEENVEGLLATADFRMYTSKRSGGDQVVGVTANEPPF